LSAFGFVVFFSALSSAQTYSPQPAYGQQGYGSQPSAPYGQSTYGGQPSYGSPGPSPGGLQSGGLTPPPAAPGVDPLASAPPSTATEQELESADRRDTGRGLEFVWLNAEIGFEHLGLETFKAKSLVDAQGVSTTQTGPVYGAGLGVRLVFLTLGARFRYGSFSDWQLWTLNGELGLHIPLGMIEPYLTLGGGYASLGSFDTNNLSGDLNGANVRVRGFDVRGGVGLDLYLSNLFSVGANLTGEVLALTRPSVDPQKLKLDSSTNSQQATAKVYAADGSSIGSGVTLTAVAGLHF
jgi:hypothetical protein